VKCECLVRVRGYLLIAGDWRLKVGDGKHNHEMSDKLTSHKTTRRLNSNESRYLRELTYSNLPLRKFFTNLRKRNSRTSTTIKHIYNSCHVYMQSIMSSRISIQHLLKSLVENKYVYYCRKYPDPENNYVYYCLSRSLRCMVKVPLIRPTSIVFCCLSLLVSLLLSSRSLLHLLI